MMAPHRNQYIGGGGARSIAPTVYDKRPHFDFSLPRVMAMFWARDVFIQFGKGSHAFYREADKADIANLVLTVDARTRSEPYPKFALAVLSCFSNFVSSRRHAHQATLHWWLVRMLRELATIPDMTVATNRFPNKDVLDVPLFSHRQMKRNMKAAGFGPTAKAQLRFSKGHTKPITLPVPPANTQEEEDAA
jgi:hypothetical protein